MSSPSKNTPASRHPGEHYIHALKTELALLPEQQQKELAQLKERHLHEMENARNLLIWAESLPGICFQDPFVLVGRNNISLSALALGEVERYLELLPPVPLFQSETGQAIEPANANQEPSNERAANIHPIFVARDFIPPPEGPGSEVCWYFQPGNNQPFTRLSIWSPEPEALASKLLGISHPPQEVSTKWNGTPEPKGPLTLKFWRLT